MTVRAPVFKDVSDVQDGSVLMVTWTGVTEADSFGPFRNSKFYPMSMQVTGTIGGATVILNGSNDGTNYVALNDMSGSAISFTSNGLKTIRERTLYIQPATSGGSGQTTAVSILLAFTNPQRT